MYAMTAAVKTRFGHVLFLLHFMTNVAHTGYGSLQEAVWQCSSSQSRLAYMSRGIISTSNLGVVPGPGDKDEHAVRAWT